MQVQVNYTVSLVFSLNILQNYFIEFSCFFRSMIPLRKCTATNWCPTKRRSAAKAQSHLYLSGEHNTIKWIKYCGISIISLKKSKLYPPSEMMSSYERQSFNLPIFWHKEPWRTTCKKSRSGNRICLILFLIF